MSTLTSIGRCYQIGDTVTWTETLADYTAGAGVSVVYRFSGGTPFNQFTVAGVGTVNSWVFTMPVDKTFGLYAWQKEGTSALVTTNLASGHITFTPNYATALATTTAATNLALAEAALALILANPMQSASINGESYTYRDLSDLRELINDLKAAVLQEQGLYLAMLGLKRDRNIRPRFVQPGSSIGCGC